MKSLAKYLLFLLMTTGLSLTSYADSPSIAQDCAKRLSNPIQNYRQAIVLGNQLPQTNEGIRLAVTSMLLSHWNKHDLTLVKDLSHMPATELVQLPEFSQMITAMNNLHRKFEIPFQFPIDTSVYVTAMETERTYYNLVSPTRRLVTLFVSPAQYSMPMIANVMTALTDKLANLQLSSHMTQEALDQKLGAMTFDYWEFIRQQPAWGTYLSENMQWIGDTGTRFMKSKKVQDKFKEYNSIISALAMEARSRGETVEGHNAGNTTDANIASPITAARVQIIEWLNVELFRELRTRFQPAKAAHLAMVMTGLSSDFSSHNRLWPETMFFGNAEDNFSDQTDFLTQEEKAEILADTIKWTQQRDLNHALTKSMMTDEEFQRRTNRLGTPAQKTEMEYNKFIRATDRDDIPEAVAKEFWERVVAPGNFPNGLYPVKYEFLLRGGVYEITVERDSKRLKTRHTLEDQATP